MRTILATVLKTFLVVGIIFSAALAAYDFTVIRPRLSEIWNILAAAPGRDSNPPLLVRNMIDANAGTPRHHATSQLIFRLFPNTYRRNLVVKNWLWARLLPLHVGDDAMYGLYSSLSFNGTDYGLTKLSRRSFSKELDQLSVAEAAEVVAMTHAPNLYARDRDKMTERTTYLIKKTEHVP